MDVKNKNSQAPIENPGVPCYILAQQIAALPEGKREKVKDYLAYLKVQDNQSFEPCFQEIKA